MTVSNNESPKNINRGLKYEGEYWKERQTRRHGNKFSWKQKKININLLVTNRIHMYPVPSIDTAGGM